jgi:hypothetical protein
MERLLDKFDGSWLGEALPLLVQQPQLVQRREFSEESSLARWRASQAGAVVKQKAFAIAADGEGGVSISA